MTVSISDLSKDVWNEIGRLIERSGAPREVTFGHVIRRDVPNRLVWLEEFGDIGIPLVAFDLVFTYYDDNGTNTARRTSDIVKPQVPRVGQMVVVLNPSGQRRFPFCVGVVQSTGHWQGEV